MLLLFLTISCWSRRPKLLPSPVLEFDVTTRGGRTLLVLGTRTLLSVAPLGLIGVVLAAAANIDKILDVFGTRGILAGFLLIALGFGVGWLLGGPGIDTRRALALGTGQRNIAAALVIATESFGDTRVVIMVIVVTLVGLLTLIPLCHVLANCGFKQFTE